LLAVSTKGKIGLFAGIGEVLVDGGGDDVVGGFFEIGLEKLAEFQKLGPQAGVEIALGNAQHDGAVALAAEAVGSEAMAAGKGHEEPSLPGVGQTELEFEEGLGGLDELLLQTVEGGPCGFFFTGEVGGREEGFDFAYFFEKFHSVHSSAISDQTGGRRNLKMRLDSGFVIGVWRIRRKKLAELDHLAGLVWGSAR